MCGETVKFTSVKNILTKSRLANKHWDLLNGVNVHYVSSVSQTVSPIISSWEVCMFYLYPWYSLGACFGVSSMATCRI